MILGSAKPYVIFPCGEQEGTPFKLIITDGGILPQNPAREVRISPPAHARGRGDSRRPAPVLGGNTPRWPPAAGWGFGFFTPLNLTSAGGCKAHWSMAKETPST